MWKAINHQRVQVKKLTDCKNKRTGGEKKHGYRKGIAFGKTKHFFYVFLAMTRCYSERVKISKDVAHLAMD